MINNPLVSIIIPVYNVENFLDRCLQSLINQTYSELEILLIDDGSTDCSGKICDQYGRKYSQIKVIHQKNQGANSARNKGIQAAKGSYLMFVDSDDVVSPVFVEHAVNKIVADQADMVVFDYQYIRNGEIILPEPNYHQEHQRELQQGNMAIKKLLIADHIQNYLWNKIYKRELWRNGIVLSRNFIFQDVAALMQIIRDVHKISYLPENLYYYSCDNTNSNSNSGSLKPWNKYCQFKALQYSYLAASALQEEKLEKITITKRMRSAIETTVVEYSKPNLTKE